MATNVPPPVGGLVGREPFPRPSSEPRGDGERPVGPKFGGSKGKDEIGGRTGPSGDPEEG